MSHTRSATETLAYTTSASPQPASGSRRRHIVALTVLTSLVLFVSTACTASPGANGSGDTFTVLVVIALIAGVAMLRAVGRMFGELFQVLTNVAAALAKLGLIAALTVGAIIVAFAVLTQQ